MIIKTQDEFFLMAEIETKQNKIRVNPSQVLARPFADLCSIG